MAQPESPQSIDYTTLVYCRNDARFVTECIESLLNQTVPPDEIIAYDAGSSDGSNR